MKPEINNENKAKFFALYWGTFVAFRKYHVSSNDGQIIDVNRYLFDDIDHLKLKSLSSITDEDAEVIDLQSEDYNENGWWDKHGDFYWWASIDVDYLRLKGYALPWMGLSVEEMVEAGWVKLTT